MDIGQSNWICFQIGAREHYAIPRILEQQQQLTCLITDAWIDARSPLNLLPKPVLSNLRERYHSQLNKASVHSFNNSLIQFEIQQKFKRQSGWQTIIARNNWFQEKSIQFLKQNKSQISEPVTVFAYSYAALEIFKYAKKQGWGTILCQIDPGIYEEELVKQEYKSYPQYALDWQFALPEYWQLWQKECNLADKIIVNSKWSSKALQKTGVTAHKIKHIPLGYKLTSKPQEFTKFYPKSFSYNRPLKVLFLGQIILRKGVARIIEAIELLKNEPIEFWFVGSLNINLPQKIQNNPKVRWFGSVSRSTTAIYYQQADVFLFPTLSDGFGLTQLEAQAWQLPIIASSNCGEVITDRVNGLLLPEITPKSIAQALLLCLYNPNLLQQFSQRSHNNITNFSLDKLGQRLQLLNVNKVKTI